MGCCSSNAIHPLNSLQSGVQKDAAPRQPPISNKQADLIQSSWQGVETDLQGHGLTLFERYGNKRVALENIEIIPEYLFHFCRRSILCYDSYRWPPYGWIYVRRKS